MKIEVTEEYILGAMLLEARKRFPEHTITIKLYTNGEADLLATSPVGYPKIIGSFPSSSLAEALQKLLSHEYTPR